MEYFALKVTAYKEQAMVGVGWGLGGEVGQGAALFVKQNKLLELLDSLNCVYK